MRQMTKLLKQLPQPTTNQFTNTNVCEFGEILEQFHEDFHRSDQTITQYEDTQLRALFEEILNNYTLTATQWTKLLGELVVGMYINPEVVSARSQLTSPFGITA
jgi:hypothetical protein